MTGRKVDIFIQGDENIKVIFQSNELLFIAFYIHLFQSVPVFKKKKFTSFVITPGFR